MVCDNKIIYNVIDSNNLLSACQPAIFEEKQKDGLQNAALRIRHRFKPGSQSNFNSNKQ